MIAAANQQNITKTPHQLPDNQPIVEQVAEVVNTWATQLGQLISAKSLSILCGLPTTQISAGLDEMVAQQRLRRVGPGIFTVSQSIC